MKKKYWRMNRNELASETSQFEKENVFDSAAPLSAEDRKQWERARKKRRPKTGGGSTRISLSIEQGLLKRATAFAKKHRLSRSKLIARALESELSRRSE